jgi:ribosomal protein S2
MEKDTPASENDKAIRSISIIRSLLNDDSFKKEHRTASKFFSRKPVPTLGGI